PVPRPSLSLHPSQGVSLGDTVTLRCHLPRPAARVDLYKEGYSGFEKQADMGMVHDVAEFLLVSVKMEDAVRYQCQYQVLEPPGTSKMSVPVELVVTDRRYPPPSISMGSGRNVRTGTNVTIRCSNKYNGITVLHKNGLSAPVQHRKPDAGGTATFILFVVTPADSGTYRCSYRPGGFYLLSSPLGKNVTLEVTPTTSFQGDNRWSHGNLVAAVAGSCAASFAFILVVVVSFLLAARRRRIQSPGATPRGPEAMQFQVSPADSQALTYAQLQVLTPSTHPLGSSTTPEPPVIYAQVGTGGPR
ncbi:platelet glycoprotein VI-like, partial [Meleagris gallopavo]|uniref:platelet glycoprotein VI-like n=1 Tax=Meleagris gallopavo TaxID=9103 RepID=UPI00093BFA9D